MNDAPHSPLSPDDPRLTAYAIGEMEPGERASFEALLAHDPVATAAVEEIRRTIAQVESALEHEPELPAPVPVLPPRPRFLASVLKFPQGYYAAGLAAAACFAVYLALRPPHVVPTKHPVMMTTARMKSAPAPAVAALASGAVTADKASASVQLDSFEGQATGDFDSARRMILDGKLPSPSSVRTEAYVDSFSYAYPAPEGSAPFSVTVEAAQSPWAANRILLRVGIKAQAENRAGPVATGVVLRLVLDSSKISRCRLIGYGDPAQRAVDENLEFPLGGLNVGQEKTLFLELEPALGQSGENLGFVTVDSRYTNPADGQALSFGSGYPRTAKPFAKASASFRFAAAVARFGTLLRHLPPGRTERMIEAADWAEKAATDEPDADRDNFVATARKAAELLGP
jgi:hypothetical protein